MGFASVSPTSHTMERSCTDSSKPLLSGVAHPRACRGVRVRVIGLRDTSRAPQLGGQWEKGL